MKMRKSGFTHGAASFDKDRVGPPENLYLGERAERVEGLLAQRRWDGNGKPPSPSKTKRQLVSARRKYLKGSSHSCLQLRAGTRSR